jgi:hypothetical protein
MQPEPQVFVPVSEGSCMPYTEPLDVIPLWGIMLITVAVIHLSIECGFRLGRFRRRSSELEDKPPVGVMVAATLALLAFMQSSGLERPPPGRRTPAPLWCLDECPFCIHGRIDPGTDD